MEFNNEDLIKIYKNMLLSRYFEEEIERQIQNNVLYGNNSLSIGQEASAVGAGAALNEGDYIAITHRGHSQAIGAGIDPNVLMAEIFGKATGLNGGRSGSMNLIAPSKNLLGENGIAGDNFAIACGAALTQKLKETGNAVLCFGGDGSVNNGNFHEALNLASIWKLPIVFFIENNLYSRSMPLEEHSSVINLSDRALSYNIPGITIDGNDAIETYGITKMALDYARRGDGPVLIEAQTYRISADSTNDKDSYRSINEIQSWKDEDPIPKMADYLLHQGIVNEEDLYNYEMQARNRIGEALDYALTSPAANIEDVQENVFAAK